MTSKDRKEDPVVRDGKKLSLAGVAVAPTFLFYLTILIPLWIVVLLPCTIVSLVFSFVHKTLFKTKKPNRDDVIASEQHVSVSRPSAEISNRKFDIVVFGATGFTGRKVAAYLSKQYGNTVRWAIAGRRRAALEDVRAEVLLLNQCYEHGNPELAIPIVLADSSDLASLDTLTAQTVCVLTTAGPFEKYGSLLVQSCARQGTHYCDVTAETDWVRKMIDSYDDLARQSGARIVHFCGHDCVPQDLLILECSKYLRARGDELASVRFYDEIHAAPSGGTMSTLFNSLKDRVLYRSKLGFDPMLKTAAVLAEGKAHQRSTTTTLSRVEQWLRYSKECHAWVGPFSMAKVMWNCVRRSNVLNHYTTTLSYYEAAVYPNFLAALVDIMYTILLGTVLLCPPFCYIVQHYVLPQPGEGPSEKELDRGYLKVTAFGAGRVSGGAKVKAVFYFPTDPFYRDTARMLVEAGLALALQSDQIKVKGGVFTPASCQGDLLLQRLINTGCYFSIE